MSNTVAEIDLQPVSQNALSAGFARMDKAQKTRLGLGVLALVAIALAFFFMGQQPEWKVLYTNLSDKDGGAIVTQLTQMNVPYKHTEGGGSIMVPADKVHDTRLRLASLGLPKGTVNGFELMEANRFGMTQFQERLTFQRGLEGELTRSIQSLSSVASARIHLALPNQNGFFREQQKPTASVLVTLHPGRSLDKQQIAGIVHLVASSVPEMDPKAVSVIDDAGSLLSSTPDSAAQGTDIKKLQYTQQLEQMYTRRILDMIEPLVGEGNVKAQVSAEMDFNLVESTSELHKPNQGGEPGTVRSQQTVEDGSAPTPVPAGVPGAVSNQPPVTGTAPINGAAAPLGTASNGSADKAGTLRRESLINYEIDKTVKVVREASGTVKRLSAAVVINHRNSTDAKSGKLVTAAIPPEQLEQMTALVRETIGFNKDRGDSVNLVNAVFNVVKPVEELPVAWWRQPENMELARDMAWPLGMLGLGLLVLMGLVRPGLKLMKAPPRIEPPPQLNAMLNEEPERPGLPMPEPVTDLAPSVEALRLADAKRLAMDNPVAVANIVKGWVNGEPAAT